MQIEITRETLFIVVVAVAGFFFLQLLWQIYSDMTGTIAAVYEINDDMTPAQVYGNSRVARWNRRIFVVMFLAGLVVILSFFFPDEAAAVWATTQDFFQFMYERVMVMVGKLSN